MSRGHFYFAQRGHYHFAATPAADWQSAIRAKLGRFFSSLGIPPVEQPLP
jgi:hypothetical protein